MPASRKVKPIGKDPATRRLARYVNEKYEGNISTAAMAIGCSYDQLYTAVKGIRTRGPSLALLQQVAKHTGLPIEHWLAGDT
jgi:hypothetical protein